MHERTSPRRGGGGHIINKQPSFGEQLSLHRRRHLSEKCWCLWKTVLDGVDVRVRTGIEIFDHKEEQSNSVVGCVILTTNRIPLWSIATRNITITITLARTDVTNKCSAS